MRPVFKVLLWLAGALAGLGLIVGVALVSLAWSGRTRIVAQPIVLPPDYVYTVGDAGAVARVAKAFFVSSHGGWHGDGIDVTAYQLRPEHVSRLVAALQLEHADYRWEEVPAAQAIFSQLFDSFPPDFRPAGGTRLLQALPDDLPAVGRCLYLDRDLAVLFVLKMTF